MFARIKWAAVVVVAVVAVGVASDNFCRALVTEKMLDGLACGLMVGVVLTCSRLDRLRHSQQPMVCAAFSIVRHELLAGVGGGLLLGLLHTIIHWLQG